MRYPYFWGTLLAFAASMLTAQAIVMFRAVERPHDLARADALYSTFRTQLALSPDMFDHAQYPWQVDYLPNRQHGLIGGAGDDAKPVRVSIFHADQN